MEEQAVPDTDLPIYSIRNDVQKVGFKKLATSIALRKLESKGSFELSQRQSLYNYEGFPACRLIDVGVKG